MLQAIIGYCQWQVVHIERISGCLSQNNSHVHFKTLILNGAIVHMWRFL